MGLTEQGFYRPSYDEIVADMEQRAKEMLGENIDTSETSVLGKFIRIISYDISETYQTLEHTYYARFPNTANGVSLDRLAVFAGITRNPPTASRHKITVIGTPDTIVGMGGLIVGTEDGITFYNENDFTIGEDGTVNIIIAATEYGTSGNVDNIDTIVSPVTGITSFTYLGLEELGSDAESDFDLRKRFALAVSGAGSCTVDSIRGSVARISGVESVNIVENANSYSDTAGRPPHSFELYVYGGDGLEQEIAEAIFEKKPVGIKAVTTTDTEYTVTKSVIDNGGYSHSISFSKVAEKLIDITITIKTNSSYTSDGTIAIKNKLVEYVNNLGVGASVVSSAMYSAIFSVSGVSEIISVTQARTGETQSTETISFEQSEVPITTATNITIIETT